MALPSQDVVSVDGIRCTSATRTIIDCAALLMDEALETAFEHARRMGLTSPAALSHRAEELCGRGRPGSTRVRRLVAAQTGARPLESRLEVRMARLLRRSGLPRAERQHEIGRYRVDFAWPARGVACECDGFEHHGARLAWKRDRRRLAAIEAAGWRVVHVTWDDVSHRSDQTVARIAFALGEPAA
jgi:very-short-patch-repair endonuclease